jgi:hypothetical protein
MEIRRDDDIDNKDMPIEEGMVVTAARYFSVNPWTFFRSGTTRSEIWGVVDWQNVCRTSSVSRWGAMRK